MTRPPRHSSCGPHQVAGFSECRELVEPVLVPGAAVALTHGPGAGGRASATATRQRVDGRQEAAHPVACIALNFVTGLICRLAESLTRPGGTR
jgi:hypothetical protein